MRTKPLNAMGKKALIQRLVVAELLARPGQGPLAPRFLRPRTATPRNTGKQSSR